MVEHQQQEEPLLLQMQGMAAMELHLLFQVLLHPMLAVVVAGQFLEQTGGLVVAVGEVLAGQLGLATTQLLTQVAVVVAAAHRVLMAAQAALVLSSSSTK